MEKYLYKSNLYYPLKWKYIEKAIKPYVAIALVFWVAYLYQIITATVFVLNQPIIVLK